MFLSKFQLFVVWNFMKLIWYVGNWLVQSQQNICQVYHFSLNLENTQQYLPSAEADSIWISCQNHLVPVDMDVTTGKPPRIESVSGMWAEATSLWASCSKH